MAIPLIPLIGWGILIALPALAARKINKNLKFMSDMEAKWAREKNGAKAPKAKRSPTAVVRPRGRTRGSRKR